MWFFQPRAYRCEQCGVTSPEVYTRRELEDLQHDHRETAHGGFIPDGEAILQEPRMTLADLPRDQRIACGIVLAVLLVSFLFKIT